MLSIGRWAFYRAKGPDWRKHHWIFVGPDDMWDVEIHEGVAVGEIRQQPKPPDTAILSVSAYDYSDCSLNLTRENAERIVRCVNQVEGS